MQCAYSPSPSVLKVLKHDSDFMTMILIFVSWIMCTRNLRHQNTPLWVHLGFSLESIHVYNKLATSIDVSPCLEEKISSFSSIATLSAPSLDVLECFSS